MEDTWEEFLHRTRTEPQTDHLTAEDYLQILEVNSRTNEGRGSAVARDIVFYLTRGNRAEAAQTWKIDRDKVRQYPELMAVLNKVFRTEWE